MFQDFVSVSLNDIFVGFRLSAHSLNKLEQTQQVFPRWRHKLAVPLWLSHLEEVLWGRKECKKFLWALLRSATFMLRFMNFVNTAKFIKIIVLIICSQLWLYRQHRRSEVFVSTTRDRSPTQPTSPSVRTRHKLLPSPYPAHRAVSPYNTYRLLSNQSLRKSKPEV